MKKFQKGLALILSIVLLLGMIPISSLAGTGPTAGVTYTDMSITGVQSNTKISGTAWHIYVDTTADAPVSTFSKFVGLTVTPSMDGVDVEVFHDAGAGTKSLLIVLYNGATNTKDGDTVTVEAGYADYDTVGINLTKKCTLVYSETTGTWSLQSEYTDMDITGYLNSNVDNGHWRVNLSTSAVVPSVSGTNGSFYNGLTIETNGLGGTPTDKQVYRAADNTLMLILWGSGTTAEDGATITLKAGVGTNAEDSTIGIHILNDFTIVYDAETGTWAEKVEEESPYTQMEITGYLNSNVGNGHWRVNLSTSAVVPSVSGTNGLFYNGLTIETNGLGGTPTDKQVYRAADNTLMLILWGSGTTAEDGATITLKAGVGTNAEDSTVGIQIMEDFTIRYNGTTWEEYTVTEPVVYPGKLALSGTQTSTTGLYLTGTDGLTAPGWGSYFTAVSENDGVWLDSTRCADAQMQKYTTGTWYLGNYGGESVVKGSILKIVGQFKYGSDVVEFEEVQFCWNGQSWYEVIEPDETGVNFALNTDNSGTKSGIYLTATDSMGVSGWDKNIYAVENEEVNGVLHNGVLTDAYIRKYAEGQYYVCLGDAGIAAVAGDKVTVQGLFQYNDYAVEYNPITLLFDGTKWISCYVVTPKMNDTSGIYINTYDAAGQLISDPLAYDGGWSVYYFLTQGGLYYNGNLIVDDGNDDGARSRLVKLTENKYYVALGNTVSTSAGDTVVLDGMIQSENTVVIFERTTFKKGEDDTWSIVENTSYDKSFSMTIEPKYSKLDGDLTLTMQPSTGVLGELGKAVWSGLTVLLKGEDATSSTNLGELNMTKTDRGMLQITIPKDKIPSGNYTVTVKIGLLEPVDTEMDVEAGAMYHSKDCVTYVNEYGVGYRGYITRCNSTTADETLTLDTTNSNSTQVAFSSADKLTISSSADILAADVDSGVFINGIRHSELALKKAEGVLSVDLSGYDSLQIGDHLMVLGTLEREDEFVELAPIAVTWNGSAWSAAETSKVTAKMVLDITDDELILEGTVIKDEEGNVINERVLYTAGSYNYTRVIGDVEIRYDIILYRPNDLNVDNKYDVCDLVKIIKCQKVDGYRESMTEEAKLAAENSSPETVRKYILGVTKADEKLPTAMVGATNPGDGTTPKYITSVEGTMNGTTVISMSDVNDGFTSSADYDAYGFDYVIDVNVDRELKVLQLTDTQIINSAYGRDLGPEETTWAPDQMDEVLFDCMRETIAKTNPDLILVTGDIIYGEFDPNGESLQALIQVIESFKIPWAPVYGNHENESAMGVTWQNEQLVNSTYCLFNPRHDIGGNGNYSIGLAKKGSLQRVIYMMDSNFCTGAPQEDIANGNVITTPGFTKAQVEWYRTMALRTNEIAKDTIPSMLGFHVPPEDILLGAKAACYQEGKDDNTITYTIGVDNTRQAGDSGFKRSRFGTTIGILSDVMNEVGGDGAFFGHQHTISTSIAYAGIRWTFGLKTGAYDAHPEEQGGTLITLNSDGSFTVKHINVTTDTEF